MKARLSWGMIMKVGISTASFFGKLETEEALARIGQMGAPCCEVFLSAMREYKLAYVGELVKIARDCGVEITSAHALTTQFEPQLFSINGRQREDAMEVCERVFDAVQALGASVYVMHGPMAIKRGRRGGQWDFAHFAKYTDILADMAYERGFTLSWENVHWCQYYAPGFAKGLLAHCKNDHVSFTLDVKQAAQSGYSLADYLDEMGNRLVNVHLCDYIDRDGEIQLRLPFEDGECDMSALKASLPDSVRSVILEVYKENYRDFEHLRRCYQAAQEFFK